MSNKAPILFCSVWIDQEMKASVEFIKLRFNIVQSSVQPIGTFILIICKNCCNHEHLSAVDSCKYILYMVDFNTSFA